MTFGQIGGSRHYDGPGLGEIGVWKCPACAAENAGPIDAGCTSCGSGSARARKAEQPARVATPPDLELILDRERPADKRALGDAILAAAEQWASANPNASLVDTFVAGYEAATREIHTRLIASPPVTADTRALAPEGKPRRTIIAALELFKDQVLRQATDEIASGEWCSIEETEAMIEDLRRQEEER